MFQRCRRRQKQNLQSINEYINELKNLDCILQQMCNRVEMDLQKIKATGKKSKPTLKRLVLLRRHYRNIDERRVQVLARILQLENLHLNSMQINSIRNVNRAHKDININPDDVENLLDKLESFTDDFNDITERLNSDLAFDVDITDEELEKELFNDKNLVTDQDEVLLNFPTIPENVPQQNIKGRNLGRTMVHEGE